MDSCKDVPTGVPRLSESFSDKHSWSWPLLFSKPKQSKKVKYPHWFSIAFCILLTFPCESEGTRDLASLYTLNDDYQVNLSYPSSRPAPQTPHLLISGLCAVPVLGALLPQAGTESLLLLKCVLCGPGAVTSFQFLTQTWFLEVRKYLGQLADDHLRFTARSFTIVSKPCFIQTEPQTIRAKMSWSVPSSTPLHY